MCSDRVKWDVNNIEEYSILYQEACYEHGRAVSKRHTGKTVSIESIEKSKATKKKNGVDKRGTMNCILISTGESIHITTDEYFKHKDILYKHRGAGKPAWNYNKPHPKKKNKVSVKRIDTLECVTIDCTEYKENKHLYIHFSTGQKGTMWVYSRNQSRNRWP